MIPKVDRKWSREKSRNGMDFMLYWLQKRTDYKRGTFFFLSTFEEKGKEDATSQLNLYKAKKKKKKWNKSEKDMVSAVFFFLCQLLQISFKNVSPLKKIKTGRI